MCCSSSPTTITSPVFCSPLEPPFNKSILILTPHNPDLPYNFRSIDDITQAVCATFSKLHYTLSQQTSPVSPELTEDLPLNHSIFLTLTKKKNCFPHAASTVKIQISQYIYTPRFPHRPFLDQEEILKTVQSDSLVDEIICLGSEEERDSILSKITDYQSEIPSSFPRITGLFFSDFGADSTRTKLFGRILFPKK